MIQRSLATTNTVTVRNGIPIVHKTKVLSMSPSRTLMTMEQELLDKHLKNQVKESKRKLEIRRHTLEVNDSVFETKITAA